MAVALGRGVAVAPGVGVAVAVGAGVGVTVGAGVAVGEGTTLDATNTGRRFRLAAITDVELCVLSPSE